VPATDVPTGIPATDVPATEIPEASPSAEPTEEPTETPTPTPTPSPTPTPEPAIPFAPVLDCRLIEGGERPVAGETTWSFQVCTATWETEQVSNVELTVTTAASGWRVIAVDQDALGDPAALAASDGRLALADSVKDDDGFLTSRFFLGTQLGCSSPASATLDLDLTATSTAPVPEDADGNPIPVLTEDGQLLPPPPGAPVTETSLDHLSVDALSPGSASITIESISFTQVDLGDGTFASDGVFQISYSGAPSACGWQIVLSVSDLERDGVVVPVSGLTLTGADGGVSVTVIEPGTFRMVPAAGNDATSGTIRLYTSLVFPENVTAGMYTGRCTVSIQTDVLASDVSS
jgi:hypothetical protein